MMAGREQSQFDDAFEDAESDMPNPKTSLSDTPYIHRNGHLMAGREEQHDGTNGELPESDATGEDVQEEKTEDEWNGHPEGIEEARIESQQPLSPEDDGQDDFGDTFFVDQGDVGMQGMGYGSTYQYSEGEEGTREGTEDSGQGQIRDDLTESDKDKDYLEDVTQENRGVMYDRDDHYEDSGVVDDNGMMDVEGGMHGYEAEEDHVEGEDRFEEVDLRYGYMDGSSYVERQSYAERQQYVEDNPAYNGSEQDYDAHQDLGDKGAVYQDYTESDLPEPASHLVDESNEELRPENRYEQDQAEESDQMQTYGENDHSRIGDLSQMTGDYVIVDRDVLAPEANMRYAASDSAEADQEEQLQMSVQEQDLRSMSSKSEVLSLDYLQDLSERRTDEISHYRTKTEESILKSEDDRRVETNRIGHVRSQEKEFLQTSSEMEMLGQARVSPKPGGSPVRGVRESHNKVPRRPAPGTAQSVHRNPTLTSTSKAVSQSQREVAQVPQTKGLSPVGSQHDGDQYDMRNSDLMSRRSPKPMAQPLKDGVTSQERARVEGTGRPTSGDRPRNMPLPGGAQPVSLLKSRLREELKEMYEIEKNLASTSIQPEVNRTQNSKPKRGGTVGSSPREGTMSSRHNAEYASVSSLGSSGTQMQTSPTQYSQQPPTARGTSRSPSSSPEKIKMARSAPRDQPRNNSNANHLEHDAIVMRPKHNSRQPDSSKRHSYEIEEKSDTASGEIVFDDIAECGAYLDEKDSKPSPIKVKARQGRSITEDEDGVRRRRNSYEMANRSSSEDEDHDVEERQKEENGLLGIGNQGGNLLGNGARGTGMNSSLLSQLAERELASLRNSYKKPQEEVQEYPQRSHSTTSTTSSTSSTPGDGQRKVLPNLSPMEYDAVGFRLAGHAGIGESTLNLNAVQTQQAQPEDDQFSDAEEDGSEPVFPPRGNTMITPSHSMELEHHPSPLYGKRPLEDTWEKTSPTYAQQQHHSAPQTPLGDPVDVNSAMKDIHSALSMSTLMKAPSFYTPEQRPIWILQPDAAVRHEEVQKKTRVMEDRRRR